ncbi:tetratricopeptide repeat protein [Streptomyces acidiscabies]|uniref:tetratricopeptide repeat protein n=1 Tax=Streptomyces acidiscabies TaxID=42234 RepID=UPI00095106B9|nr:tetratricopeptide repeat protein [Streptomyces acidiscabies]
MSGDYGDHVDFRGGVFTGPIIGRMVVYSAPSLTVDNLPRRPFGFVGRQRELARLAHLLRPSRRRGPHPSVVHGMAGVGKTSLVVEAAHDALERGWFPGGALYLSLRGYDPSPVEPGSALSSLVRSLGVAVEFIPDTLDDRSALYRALLERRAQAGEPVLVVLDDASSAAQVIPLLPPPGPCRTVITSRHHLSLPNDSAISLDVLSPEESRRLLDHSLRIADRSDDRIARDAKSADALITLCGRLPLALQIIAARLAGDPGQSTASLAEKIAATGDRLSALDDGERSVRDVLDLSYWELPENEARLLRLLSVPPGPEFDTEVADTLLGEPSSDVLLGLARAGFLTRTPQGRWRTHDLVRVYAHHIGDLAEQTTARERLLAYYTRTVDAVARRLRTGDGPREPFAEAAQALAWLDRERVNLVSAVQLWADDPRILDLALALFPYLRAQDLVPVASVAVRLAELRGATQHMASACDALGGALASLEDFATAADLQRQALACFTELGDVRGEVRVLTRLATTLARQGLAEQALAAVHRSLELSGPLGDPGDRADAWNALGRITRNLGRTAESRDAFGQAVSLSLLAGDRRREAVAWHQLGMTFARAGDPEKAAEAYGRVTALTTGAPSPYGPGKAWGELALRQGEQGRADLARRHWRRAAEAYLSAGNPLRAAIAREHARDA